MKKKLTPLQLAYKKELQRLRKGFYRHKKKGYIFPEEEFNKIPKRVTQKALEKIKSIKPKELTKITDRIDYETGEIIASAPTKEKAKSEDTYIPSISIIDAIRDKINTLPDVNRSARGGIPIAQRRNALLDMLEDNINALDDKALEKYIDYLLKNQHELFQSLDRIMYDSKDEKIDASFAQAGRIINYGQALTAMQAESLNSMQEYI